MARCVDYYIVGWESSVALQKSLRIAESVERTARDEGGRWYEERVDQRPVGFELGQDLQRAGV